MRNLRDGRVELLAEGHSVELDRFLAAVTQAMSGYIDSQDVETIPATGARRSFDITH